MTRLRGSDSVFLIHRVVCWINAFSFLATMPDVDVKVTFANERTFLAWLHMAVALGTVAASLLSFGAQESSALSQDTTKAAPSSTKGKGLTTVAGLILLPVAALYAVYAAILFYNRLEVIRNWKAPQPVVIAPMIMGIILMLALLAIMWIHL